MAKTLLILACFVAVARSAVVRSYHDEYESLWEKEKLAKRLNDADKYYIYTNYGASVAYDPKSPIHSKHYLYFKTFGAEELRRLKFLKTNSEANNDGESINLRPGPIENSRQCLSTDPGMSHLYSTVCLLDGQNGSSEEIILNYDGYGRISDLHNSTMCLSQGHSGEAILSENCMLTYSLREA